jgi:hypothetical protein
VIDFRIAFRSHTLFEALARRSPRSAEPGRALAHAVSDAELPPVALDEHVRRWTSVLDRHGVSVAMAFAGCPEEIDVAAEGAERSKGRLVPFAPFDPTRADAPERAARLLGARGFAGLVLRPATDGYRISDPKVAPSLDVIDEHGGIAVVQCGLPPLGLERAFGIHEPFRAELANPLDLLAPAGARPRLAFVVPHFGSGYLRELLMLATHCANVHTDTSFAETSLRTQSANLGLADLFQRALDVMGPHRVLFATGSEDPSAGWDHAVLTHQREALGACGLGEDETQLVFDGNARRLLGLPVPEPHAIPTTH